MSQRDAIKMTESETWDFLAEPNTLVLATLRPDGRPHLVAMWYGLDGDALVFWSYASSQKIVNLRRDDRVTCLVEAGTVYSELRGIEVSGRAVINDDEEEVARIGTLVAGKYGLPNDRQSIQAAGRKRVAVRIEVGRVVSWDHRKIAPQHGAGQLPTVVTKRR